MPPELQSHQQRRYPVVLSVLLLLFLSLEGGFATRFDFRTLTLGSLKLLGDAHHRDGSIRLSRDLPVPNSGAGRALYAEPVRLRHPSTRLPLPFSTFFSFSDDSNITSRKNTEHGDGAQVGAMGPDFHCSSLERRTIFSGYP